VTLEEEAPMQSNPETHTDWREELHAQTVQISKKIFEEEQSEDEQELEEDSQDNYPYSPKRNLSKKTEKKSKAKPASNGLKKRGLKKAKELDRPPTPIGCEWRETDGGWNLFRCWSERDEVLGGRYKKERYVGFLGKEAWQVMKQYDYETFISIIGQRFRRHGGR